MPRHSAAGIGRRLRSRIENLVGLRVVSTRCAPGRGFTLAERWIVLLEDSSTRFVKVGDDAASRHQIRAEAAVLATARLQVMPKFYGFDDHPIKPLLVTEDMAASYWPPPWRPGDVDAVRSALDVLHSVPPPSHLAGVQRGRLDGWRLVAEDPGPFLDLGIVSGAWLDRNLGGLAAAADAAPLDGEALVHLDVRSDNLCLRGDRVVFVDWGLSVRANPALDLAFWAPSVAAEGGPRPDDLFDGAPTLAAFVAGYFASRAGLAPYRWGAGKIRMVQRDQLGAALPWACRVLGIELPDGIRS